VIKLAGGWVEMASFLGIDIHKSTQSRFAPQTSGLIEKHLPPHHKTGRTRSGRAPGQSEAEGAAAEPNVIG